MPTTLTPKRHGEASITVGIERGARRFGYVVAAAINGVLLWVVHQLLDWGWPDFLTPEFDDLLPIITVSFVAGVIANLVYAWDDAPPVKAAGELVTSAIGLIAAVWTYRVFPFDFSGYDTNWSWLARLVVVIAIVGSAVGGVVALVKLVTGRFGDDPDGT